MLSSAISLEDKRKLAAALLVKQQRANTAVHGATMDRLSWSSLYRCSLKEGVLFDLATHPFLRDIYLCSAMEIVVYKASQMGASEFAVSDAIYSCDQRGATVLYLFPSDRAVSDFSSARIGPAIDASEYLKTIVTNKEEGGRRTNRVTLKQIRNGILYLRGAKVSPSGSAPQLLSIDADKVIFDELNATDERAVAIALKRLNHSNMREVLYISTPTYKGRGIHARFLLSDGREWHVRCPHCNDWQMLTMEQVVIEWDSLQRPLAWHGMRENRAFFACTKCGKELNRLAKGEWVAAYPSRTIAGFHLSRAFSPFANVYTLIEPLFSVDETTRKECVNQDWGIPHTPRGGGLDETILDDCRRDYGFGIVHGERPYAGIDVGSVLHMVIRAPLNADGERPLRWAGELSSFEEVGRKLKEYDVGVFVMDALPETHSVKKFLADFPDGMGWASYYEGKEKGEDSVSWKEREATVSVDRTRILDELTAGFIDRVTNILPLDIRNLRDYYDHLQASNRVIEKDSKGNDVAKYVEEDRADHFFHAEAYCLVASKRKPPQRSRSKPNVVPREAMFQ